MNALRSILRTALYPAWLVLKYVVLVPLDKLFYDGLGVLWRSEEELKKEIIRRGLSVSLECPSLDFLDESHKRIKEDLLRMDLKEPGYR